MYADYECSLKALYEEYYARTDQRAAEMTSCVDSECDFIWFYSHVD